MPILLDADEIYVGQDVVSKIYLGEDLIVYTNADQIYGRCYLYSTNTLGCSGGISGPAKASLFSTSDLKAIEESTKISFETLYIITVGGELPSQSPQHHTDGVIIEEMVDSDTTTETWRVYCEIDNPPTYYYNDIIGADFPDVLEMHIIKGDTLTTLHHLCYSQYSMHTFSWSGGCITSDYESAWEACNSLENWSFDGGIQPYGGSPATYTNAFTSCSALPHLPSLNTTNSAGGYTDNFDYMFYGCSSLECLTDIDTTNLNDPLAGVVNMFTGCTSLINPNATEQSSIENGYDYVNTNPCPTGLAPPIYNLTEQLVDDLTDYYVVNSASSGSIYNGHVEYRGDGTEPDGEGWYALGSNPDIRYPRNGTFDLTAGADGRGSLRINTQWIPSQTTEWYISAVYDVVMGTSYKMYLLEYKGNGLANVWYGSEGVPLALTWANTNLQYSPPQTPYEIVERPNLPIIPFVTMSTVPNITDTNPHQVTLTFNTAPKPTFLLSDITYNAVNGTINNLQESPTDDRIWTFDYTANAGIDDTTNVITIGTNYYDSYANKATTPSVSNNFTILTSTPAVDIVNDGDFLTGTSFTTYGPQNALITWQSATNRWYFNNTTDNTAIRQSLVLLQPNTSYTIEFQISGYVRGGITARIVGMVESYIYRSANGIFTQNITSGGTVPQYLMIQGQYLVGFQGYIEYVKVLEV